MLTHSGVRPFKYVTQECFISFSYDTFKTFFRCAENECTAAFTTKQCLQFHYKKVHGFTQEQMPKIERSVAYTFDAYSGGLKHEALGKYKFNIRILKTSYQSIFSEGMTRRQRKNLGESLNKATRSMPQREKEMILKDKNFLSSITDLCKNESNLNLLSTKISSILNCNLKEMNKKLLTDDNSEGIDMESDGNEFQESNEFSENLNNSDVETKLIGGKTMRNLLEQKRNEETMLNDSISGNDTNDMENVDEEDECDGINRHSFKAPANRRTFLDSPQQLSMTSNPRFKDFLLQTNPNLVISKGSKKWISDNHLNEVEDNDISLMTQANRDFLAKLISSKLHKGSNNQTQRNIQEVTSNHSPIDVDSNLHHQQQSDNEFNQNFNHPQSNSGLMDIQTQFQNEEDNHSNQFNAHFGSLGNFYNSNSNTNRNMNSSIPTSASLLVEAALNSVSNIIGNNGLNDGGSSQQMSLDEGDNHQTDLHNELNNGEFQSSHMMNSVDENMKILKTQNFPIHLHSMTPFNNDPENNMMHESNENEVEPSGSSKSHEKICSYVPTEKEASINSFQNQPHDSCSPARTMTPDQHNTNFNPNFTNQRNLQTTQIQTSPGQIPSRPIYGSEHELASPASTPSLPRYDFGSENYRRREKNMGSNPNIEYQKSMQNHHHQLQTQSSQIAQISSDEENSIVIAENLSVSQQNQNHIVSEKLKLNSQIDLIYSNNGNSITSQSNLTQRESLNDLRVKYNEHGLELQDFTRNSVSDNNGSLSGSDYQGLDMSSR